MGKKNTLFPTYSSKTLSYFFRFAAILPSRRLIFTDKSIFFFFLLIFIIISCISTTLRRVPSRERWISSTHPVLPLPSTTVCRVQRPNTYSSPPSPAIVSAQWPPPSSVHDACYKYIGT